MKNQFTHSAIKLVTATAVAALLAITGLAGCGNLINEDKSVYHIRFRYDYNMKWEDTFSSEVNSVTLYVINAEGNVVLTRTESGEALKTKGYKMDVEVAPGRYTLIAWAGDTECGTFRIPQSTRQTDLVASILPEGYQSAEPYDFTTRMDRLYYGVLSGLDFSKDSRDTFVVPLIKNTNDIRVNIKYTYGDPVDADMFHYTITDSNGAMAYDNSLLCEDQPVTYHAWRVDSEEGTLFTVPRLMANHASDAKLNIVRNGNGETVISIPLIETLLRVKGYYNRNLSDQEFLDRQDDYSITFFLDENGKWVSDCIYVLSWHIFDQDVPV